MGRKTIAMLGTAAVFRIALFVVVVTVLVFVPSALAGKGGGGNPGGGGPNGGSGTIALTLLELDRRPAALRPGGDVRL